tara:strand:+ start:2440 stop:2907 length:468 start_codon:yes stop_codon:yes gene_type:complete
MRTIIRNTTTFLLTIILLANCGFTPMYKDFSNTNFSIKIDQMSGNRNINNKIKNILSKYNFTNKNRNFNVSFDTEYRKNIVAKDTTGAATEYKIIVETEFTIISEEFQKQIKISESFNMQSMSDKLEEQDYENNINDNLSNTISRKLILQLSQIK